MKRALTIALCFVLLITSGSSSWACSAFCLVTKAGPVCGQNYDWHLGDGLVLINKRGIQKQGLVDDSNPAEWTSRFGSVTFNQYGREFPCGGMNEAGLVITISMLGRTRYPDEDDRAAVNVPQWIQYQLDTANSVADVLASDEEIRIAAVSNARVHFFVTDKSGDCATVEFLRGKMVVHRGEDLPFRVLTNSTYESSSSWVAEFEGFGGDRRVGNSFRGSRFATAAERLSSFDDATDPVKHAFITLNRIAQGHFTKWSIVYDSAGQKIHFRTLRAHDRRTIDLAKCDFSPASPVKMLDINARHGGDALPHFVDYSAKKNRQVATRTLRGTGVLNGAHRSTIDRVCRYPETCVPVKNGASLSPVDDK